MFCARNVPRKFQNCFEFNKHADSFPAKSAQVSRKNTHISAKVRKSGFLNCCKFGEALALYHQQFQWLNCEGPIAANIFFTTRATPKVAVRTAVKSSLFVESVYI
jgi:hypothetical protein